MSEKLIFVVFARKSPRSNWNEYGHTEAKEHADVIAQSLYKDCAKDTAHNWEISIQTIYYSTLEEKYNGNIPNNLKFNVYWPEAGFIPFAIMQTQPDQQIYNGGN